ncbi:MAG TPA: mechanosensitive ion channel family protein [Steroidobacteraceae bacterium]|jgi:small-conductance mechanosensitive channel|nr:mechanosensitive ion channel family protein [Steroidobacteraceae bacterium]
MAELKELFDWSFFNNPAWRWMVAGAIALGVLLVLLVLRRVASKQYTRLAATPQDEFLEIPLHVASRTTVWFLLIAAVFVGLESLELPDKAARVLITVFTVAGCWQIGLWATTAVLALLDRRQRKTLATDRAAAGSLSIIGFMARLTIWALVLLLTLDNLGIEIKPLLAGLGIGGIAVALAAQNILGDLFASLSITLDRPFVLGDSLQIDDFSGTVEYIGVKSTRLRSVNGELIIIPNSNLVASRVRNNTRATDRRVVFTISVSQDTPLAELQKIPELIRSLIEAYPDVRFDRSHFAKITAASFDFEAVYVVKTTEYNRHMDILQEINLRLVEAFQKQNVAFAYPMQRLYLEQQQPVQSQLVSEHE